MEMHAHRVTHNVWMAAVRQGPAVVLADAHVLCSTALVWLVNSNNCQCVCVCCVVLCCVVCVCFDIHIYVAQGLVLDSLSDGYYILFDLL